ncbi:MAG: endonuclease/exonuclease/phosphatase family protein [Flavobacteriales bacterium]|nr:endonuclease/exonuclease/phosphatase family protein [Flavobacteriales bacterium]MCB9196753.1 endonuclease/exonuclease/phosphatase family protein [Flavobacteriales bacterium]
MNAQKEFEVACIGFYNQENLFDTIVDPDTNKILQDDFTPKGPKNWDSKKYKEKLENMSFAISKMGLESTPDGMAVLGLAEIENRLVLEDLVAQEAIKERDYQIVHYDSPDRRGIDVALLYNPKYFQLESSKTFTLKIDGMDDFYTRDQLLVSGNLLGERMHFIVCHWPSRRGGEKRSGPLRVAAAELTMQIMDSIRVAEPDAKIIMMGDLNDDPVSKSVKKVMKPMAKPQEVESTGLFNPMADLYTKGIGSLGYNDGWNLFDQMILSSGLIDKDKTYNDFGYYSVKVFNEPFLIAQEGQYKNYPHRTYSRSEYIHGYSDHFPVYVTLLRAKK